MLPSWIIEPLWSNFTLCSPTAQTSTRWAAIALASPIGWVFDKLLQVLVSGCAHQRIADHTCSERTLRRRRDSGSLPVSPTGSTSSP
jgi:hypothetical protein